MVNLESNSPLAQGVTRSSVGMPGVQATWGSKLIEDNRGVVVFNLVCEFVHRCLQGKLHHAASQYICSANSVPLKAPNLGWVLGVCSTVKGGFDTMPRGGWDCHGGRRGGMVSILLLAVAPPHDSPFTESLRRQLHKPTNPHKHTTSTYLQQLKTQVYDLILRVSPVLLFLDRIVQVANGTLLHCKVPIPFRIYKMVKAIAATKGPKSRERTTRDL